MKIFHKATILKNYRGSALAIGNFDGVHKGHQKVFKYAKKFSNNIQCFINCAGFSKWSPIEKVNNNEWNEMIDVNLKGAYWGCKVASQQLRKGTSIINISSLAGKRGSANNSLYCISKFGIT